MTPQDERDRQNRILDAAARKYARRYQAVLDGASERMIAEYLRTGAAPRLPDDFERRLSDAFLAVAGDMMGAFGVHEMKSTAPLEHKSWAEFFQQLAIEYLQQEAIRRRIVGITETTRQLIINLVSIGQDAGEGVDQIGRRMTDVVPAMSRYRANLIARTETHGAANFGAWRTSQAIGTRRVREWISTEDPRTRDFGEGDAEVDEFNHRRMNGVREDGNGFFQVPHKNGGTEALRFPGDPNASPGNTINCRCAVAYVRR
jgi:uncharacterized protein with gpF-like domain